MDVEDFKNGQLILIDKPLNWTSFQVVNKLRWVIRKKFNIKKIKVGHAGTLDPLATGLLIICTGKFTKKLNLLQAETKEYTGMITLGATTPSFDLETETDKTFSTEHITDELIKDTTNLFIGEIDQKPPLYSAIKKDGVRLYELARKHCGNKHQWAVSVEILHNKSGSRSGSRRFRQLVKDVAKTDHLPQYEMKYIATKDQILFINREACKPKPISDVAPLKVSKEAMNTARGIVPAGEDVGSWYSNWVDRILDGKYKGELPYSPDLAFLGHCRKRRKAWGVAHGLDDDLFESIDGDFKVI